MKEFYLNEDVDVEANPHFARMDQSMKWTETKNWSNVGRGVYVKVVLLLKGFFKSLSYVRY